MGGRLMGKIQIETETLHMIAGNIQSTGRFDAGQAEVDSQSEIAGLSDVKSGIDSLNQLSEQLNSTVESFANSLNMMADTFKQVDLNLGNQIGD